MKHNIEIEKTQKYDVVVCGGGMTGTAAAIASSRAGMKTLLIERNGCLGGTATSGSVRCLLGGIDYKEDEYYFLTGGLFKEIYYELLKDGNCVDIYEINRSRNPHAWHSGLANSIIFDNEAMKRLLDKKVLESGAKPLYYTNAVDVMVKNKRIEYIVTANKSGFSAVYADFFIDCTGDADLAVMAGDSHIKGRESDNLMTPATLIMNLENVDTQSVLDYIEENNSPRFKELILDMKKQGNWPFPFEIFISFLLTRPGEHMINTIRQVGVDGTDADSLTAAAIEGRLQNKKLYDIIKGNFPGYKDSHIASTAENIGIRETRRIKGDFVLGLDMLLEGVDFPDTVALSSYGFDLPDPKKPSYQPLEGKRPGRGHSQIPYRCLVPDKTNNLLVAGRSISVERNVLGPLRVMGPCTGMGQAAGTAAGILAKQEKFTKEIDYEYLRNELKQADCIVDINDIEKVRRQI